MVSGRVVAIFEKRAGLLDDFDFEVVEEALLGGGDDLLVAESGEGSGAPVHHAFAAVDEAFGVKIDEGLLDFAGVGGVHREPFAVPVAGAAEFFQLIDDDPAVGVLPRPDAFQEGVATEVVAGLLFLLAEAFFDDGLGGDAGMVGAGEPEDLVAGEAGAAGEDVLDRVVEDVAEREDAGDVGWRNDNGVGWLGGFGVGGEIAGGEPLGVPFFFDGLGFVAFRDLGHGPGIRIRGGAGETTLDAGRRLGRREVLGWRKVATVGGRFGRVRRELIRRNRLRPGRGVSTLSPPCAAPRSYLPSCLH